MFDLLSKVIRRLIELDILGNRSLCLMDMGISYDVHSKRLFQMVEGTKVYLARCSHGLPRTKGLDMVEWVNKQIYFSHFMPTGDDVYIDVGCGYGHEMIFLAKNNPDLKIVGIEANPEVFHYCKVSTAPFKNITVLNLMIGEKESYKLPFTTDYAGKGASDEGFVECRGCTFEKLLELEKINKVSLLKVNIEGGEKELIKNLPHSKVKNIIVSCHDFRFERGDGDFYRTYSSVRDNLISFGYSLSDISPNKIPSKEWEKSIKYWVYATKET